MAEIENIRGDRDKTGLKEKLPQIIDPMESTWNEIVRMGNPHIVTGESDAGGGGGAAEVAPTRRREKVGVKNPAPGGRIKERCISGDARTARRALVVLAAIGGHVTPQPNLNWCGCVVCDCARRCAALGKGAFLCKVVMIMVGAVGA